MSVRGDFLGSPHSINTTALILLYLYFILGIIKYKKKKMKKEILLQVPVALCMRYFLPEVPSFLKNVPFNFSVP